MSQNNIEGTFSISGDGETVLTTSPFPVCGTVTIDATFTGFTGNIVPKLRGRNAAAAGTAKTTIYQKASATADVGAGTALAGDDIFYVRLDGTRLSLVTSGYAAGSVSGTWSWSKG